MKVTPWFAAILLAAVVAFAGNASAQQLVPGKVGGPAQAATAAKKAAPLPLNPAARHAALTEQLNQNTVTVMSGNPNGTYLYLAYDMSAVLDDGSDLRVLPIIGKGGYQNVIDTLHLRGVDLCITQANIMSYLKKTGEFGTTIDQRLAYIARLYNEEMHILAGSGINRVQDLNGKKVNFSDVGSGTQFSARLIFELLKIRVQEVNVGQADGYEKVRSGEIAATILIAGKPTGAFGKFKMEPGMTLLPVPYTEALEQDYLPAKLTSEDYPNLIPKGGSVDTVAIPSVLAVYNWGRDTDRYRRVSQFIDAFFTKFPEFQKAPRHVKWKETNLSATLRGWKRFPAAEEWLAKSAQRPTASVAIDPTIVRTQAARAAPNDPAEQERLFMQFMEWSRAQQKR
ncbi:MAG: TAXI family TRAP transporter solute-binding subunit [Hyphomicrobiaceae bacterium]